MTKNCSDGFDIYVKEKAVLGRAHVAAFKELGIQLGEELKADISKKVYEWLDEDGLPNDVSIDADEDTAKYYLMVESDADKKEVKDWLKESKPSKVVKDAINAILKNAKARRPTGEEVEKGREKCAKNSMTSEHLEVFFP